MGIKIAIVGAGSPYTAGMIKAILEDPSGDFKGATLSLMDLRPRPLEAMRDFAVTLAKRLAAPVRVESTTQLGRALEGSDFVITTIRVGGLKHLLIDEKVPKQFGLIGNETIGIGGIFKAARTIPPMLEIAAAVERRCPKAWVLNFTNPTQYIADAVRRRFELKFVSLCDGIFGAYDLPAKLLGVSMSDIQPFVGGTNHHGWILDFTCRGRSGYPLLRRKRHQIDESKLQACERMALRLYDLHGILPNHAWYQQYYQCHNDMLEWSLKKGYVTMGESFLRGTRQTWKFFRDYARGRVVSPAEGRVQRTGFGHGRQVTDFMRAVLNDLGTLQIVNIPNRGAVSNLPDRAIVEVTAVCGRTGPRGVAVGPLPPSVLAQSLAMVLHEELTVDAVLARDKRLLMQAIMAHPLIHDLGSAERCAIRLFQLHAPNLRGWKDRGGFRLRETHYKIPWFRS